MTWAPRVPSFPSSRKPHRRCDVVWDNPPGVDSEPHLSSRAVGGSGHGYNNLLKPVGGRARSQQNYFHHPRFRFLMAPWAPRAPSVSCCVASPDLQTPNCFTNREIVAVRRLSVYGCVSVTRGSTGERGFFIDNLRPKPERRCDVVWDNPPGVDSEPQLITGFGFRC